MQLEAKPLFCTIKLTAAPQRNCRQLANGPNEEHLFELSLDEEKDQARALEYLILFVLLLWRLTEARHTGLSGTVIYGNLNFTVLIRFCIIRVRVQLLIPASVLWIPLCYGWGHPKNRRKEGFYLAGTRVVSLKSCLGSLKINLHGSLNCWQHVFQMEVIYQQLIERRFRQK